MVNARAAPRARRCRFVVPAFDGARPDRMVGVGLNLYDVMRWTPRPRRRAARRTATDWSPDRHRVIDGDEVVERLPALAGRAPTLGLPVLRLPDRRQPPGAHRAGRGRALRRGLRQPRRGHRAARRRRPRARRLRPRRAERRDASWCAPTTSSTPPACGPTACAPRSSTTRPRCRASARRAARTSRSPTRRSRSPPGAIVPGRRRARDLRAAVARVDARRHHRQRLRRRRPRPRAARPRTTSPTCWTRSTPSSAPTSGAGDVTGAYAGVRPLISTGDPKKSVDISRKAELYETSSGMITITGGKLTTWRRMAKMAVDRLVEREARDAPCRTHEIPLGQAVDAARAAAGRGRPRGRPTSASPAATATRRTRCSRVAGERGELAQPIVAGGPADLLAEAVYAARREQARERGRRAAAPHAASALLAARGAADPEGAAAQRVAVAMAAELGGTSADAQARGLPRRGRAPRASSPPVTASSRPPRNSPPSPVGFRRPVLSIPKEPRPSMARRIALLATLAPLVLPAVAGAATPARFFAGDADRRSERGHPVARRPRRRARRDGRAGLRQARRRGRPRLRLAAGQRRLPGARAGRRRAGRRRLAAGGGRVGRRAARRRLRQRRRASSPPCARPGRRATPRSSRSPPSAPTPPSRCRSTASPTSTYTASGDLQAARLERNATSFNGVPGPLDIDPAAAAGTGTGRPKVAVAADGVATVVWGESGHVYARRLFELRPSTAPQDLGDERRRARHLQRGRLELRVGRVPPGRARPSPAGSSARSSTRR